MVQGIRAFTLIGMITAGLLSGPATATGPMDDNGKIDPAAEAWVNSVPGNNPMTTEEAVAAMAVFTESKRVCGDQMPKFQMFLLFDDVRAGGSALEDFETGGAHYGKMRSAQVFLELAYGDANLARLCQINPYMDK